MPNFEEFSRRTAYRTNQPKITIQKGGTLSLNAAAAEKLKKEGEAEGDPIPVVLLYDKAEKIIGVRRTSESPNLYYVRKQPNSVSYLVSARGFMRYYGIKSPEARRYDARMYGENVIGFGLDDPHQVVGRG